MSKDYCIIMAGGVGSRFWPLSRTEKPKQFLDILGLGKTLLQQTYDRFANIIPKENIYIVSNEIYTDLIKEQLPEIKDDQILSEPARRNTAPCIAYAAYKIKSKDPSASIVVSPSDHLILNETEFLETIKKGIQFTSDNNQLLTLGIKPNRPETGYGYIQVDENKPQTGEIYPVKTFTEKPDIELAKIFFESGDFFWNAGIFISSLTTLIDSFELHLPEMALSFDNAKDIYFTDKETEVISVIYTACKNISIDYGIMEKANNVSVLCSDFGWSDLGTWGSLYEHSDKDENANALIGGDAKVYDCSDNIIRLPADKIAVIQGLKDYIVVQEGDVILICQKEEEQRIRQFSNDVLVSHGNKHL